MCKTSTDRKTATYDGNTWNEALCPDNVACAERELCPRRCRLRGYMYLWNYHRGWLSVSRVCHGTRVWHQCRLACIPHGWRKQLQDVQPVEQGVLDVSNIGCGLNGALYFVSMDADGGMSRFPGNAAGAAYGTGYCDAQCARDIKFINGEVCSTWFLLPIVRFNVIH